MAKSSLDSIGSPVKEIEVQFSVRSIELFSDGLYSSPHKAIEELVSNSFDAGAMNVNVILRDAHLESGSITVIDDGVGMDADAIQKHWLIGRSDKRDETYVPPRGRAPIGKFGIGKLATYVLAHKFHLISKCKGKYWVATMDYETMMNAATKEADAKNASRKQTNPKKEADTEQRKHRFWARTLTAKQAEEIVKQEVTGTGAGFDAIRLFGDDAAKTWTIAILSDLRQLSSNLKVGTAHRVLSTALPLQSDFKIFLDGAAIESSKSTIGVLGDWQLGQNFTPEIDGVVAYTDSKAKEPEERVGIMHPTLKKIYGSFTLYEGNIAEGKSDRFARSHGFFVYVRGRLINAENPYFGIPENALRHGTIAHFRMDVHIDELDEELRSSRENYKESPNVEAAREVLKQCFNHARQKQRSTESEDKPSGKRIVDRIANAPRSVTITPMLAMLQRLLDGNIKPRLSRIELSGREPLAVFDEIKRRASEDKLFTDVDTTLEFASDAGVCTYEADSGRLEINVTHPFIAHFVDDPDDTKNQTILELLATSEVLLEASLYENLGNEAAVHEILEQRDRLLRSLARNTENRSPAAIALRLLDNASAWGEFELALVDAFSALGFEARHMGKKNKADGIAYARITSTKSGELRAFSVSLEAKKYASNVGKDDAKPLTVARHRDSAGCDHAIVVARSFTDGEEVALTQEVRSQNEADRLRFERMTPEQKKRRTQPATITLARATDIAALVRLFAFKRIGLSQLRQLFACTTPDDVAEFVEKLRTSAPDQRYFQEILRSIVQIHTFKPGVVVEYSALEIELLRTYGIDVNSDEIKQACFAMEQLSNGLIQAAERHVELDSSVDKIVEAISRSINELPERDRVSATRAVLDRAQLKNGAKPATSASKSQKERR